MSWLLYGILGAILAGASPLFAKSGMRKSNVYLAAAIRGTVLFLAAWFIVRLTGTSQSLSGIGQTSFLYLIFSGIATGAVWVCLLNALQTGEVIRVVPVIEASLILDILVGIIFFKDGVDWIKIGILVLMIAGIVMVVIRSSGGRGGKRAWLGYALATMVLTTVTTVLGRIGISGVNDNFERLVRYGVALIIVWVVTFATGGYKGLRAMSFLDGIYLCLSGAVLGGAWYCFHIAYAYGANATVAMVERFDMVAAVVLGCVFMRERLSVRAIFGLIFMMSGFLLLLVKLPVIPL